MENELNPVWTNLTDNAIDGIGVEHETIIAAQPER
jgi:hypothetical protein